VGLAAECVYRQDNAAFWSYKTLLFERQGGWQTALDLEALAADVPGLDADALTTCLDERQTEGEVARDLAAAEYVGVSGTPSVVIGDQGFEAPDLDTLRTAIEVQLAN
jgi:protein-disulfide isomerase